MTVIETLREAQRFGFFGPGDIADAERHARGYVTAIGEVAPGTRIIDLGSGGGLPGLVLADAYPTASIVLLDRRQKRTDFLERAVRRHGWQDVTVRLDDVDRLVREVRDGTLAAFDVVTARGFGPPEVTLRASVGVCRLGGRIVISEPPDRDRWPDGLLTELDVTSVRIGPVRVFERR
ncbi:MAG: RsmG family class I SAM-dependent methyltransferase [Acidimicrobiia bacterium]